MRIRLRRCLKGIWKGGDGRSLLLDGIKARRCMGGSLLNRLG